MFHDIIKSFYYELISYFVPRKQKYKITGECKKCGKCCTLIRSKGMENEKDLKIMQFLIPYYKRFYITGKDENDELILSCKYLTCEGLCSVYKARPPVCRNYPAKTINFYAQMPEGCGYKIETKKFSQYLEGNIS